MQSDVAAAAVAGEGMFSGAGPLDHLRAVASLFPEPVHVVVRADSGIETVADLAGKEQVAEPHISEAVQYRTLDRNFWT